MSLSQELCHKTMAAIIDRFSLQEIGDPYQIIESQIPPGGPVGEIRIWGGEKVRKMVYVGITVPAIQLDSHMVFAFTSPSSAVPHFTLDSVLAGPTFAFHLDMIPRVDLGANLDYINAAFQPLTGPYEAARQTEGLTEARLSPRQFAVMSPWMLANRATEAAYRAVEPTIDQYRHHWADLAESGLPDGVLDGVTPAMLSERDQRNRDIIFSVEVDPVWNQLRPLIGPEMGATLRSILRNQAVESAR